MRSSLGLAALLLLTAAGEPALETLGRLDHPAIREASGIVQSRRHPGVFWVINDSGNAPALFAVARDGALIREFAVKAVNLDWEDVTLDGEGRLYVGDIGNNQLVLPRRVIYRLAEPDPKQPADGPLPVIDASYYRCPDTGRFDAEGLFIDRGRAIIVAKYLDRREAELFAVPFDPPAPPAQPATARLLGRLAGCTEPVTGAALSNDRKRLAVCSYGVVRIYDRADLDGDAWTPLATVPFDARDHGIEAVCWDGADLMLAGESRGLFRIAERTWKPSAKR